MDVESIKNELAARMNKEPINDEALASRSPAFSDTLIELLLPLLIPLIKDCLGTLQKNPKALTIYAGWGSQILSAASRAAFFSTDDEIREALTVLTVSVRDCENEHHQPPLRATELP